MENVSATASLSTEEQYKENNRALSLRVNVLLKENAELRNVNNHLNGELLEYRKQMNNIKDLVLETIQNNSQGYNRIVMELMQGKQYAVPKTSESKLQMSKHSTESAIYPGPSASPHSTQMDTDEVLASPTKCPERTTDMSSSSMPNVTCSFASRPDEDESESINSSTLLERSNKPLPMPVRVDLLLPDSSQLDDDEEPDAQPHPATDSLARLNTILERTEYSLDNTSIADPPTFLAPNVSIRKASTNFRKCSSIFMDSNKENSQLRTNQSAILQSLDDISIEMSMSAASPSVSAHSHRFSQNESDINFTLMTGATCSTPVRQNGAMDSFDVANNYIAAGHTLRYPRRVLTNISRSAATFDSTAGRSSTNTIRASIEKTSTSSSALINNEQSLESGRPRRKAAPTNLHDANLREKLRQDEKKKKKTSKRK